jgi:hypothetical protein
VHKVLPPGTNYIQTIENYPTIANSELQYINTGKDLNNCKHLGRPHNQLHDLKYKALSIIQTLYMYIQRNYALVSRVSQVTRYTL